MDLAPSISAVVAVAAFIFAVWNNSTSLRRESSRRDWERLQALAQVLHQGSQVGLWAQKLAVAELEELKTKPVQALFLAKAIMQHWDKQQVDPDIKRDLQALIDRLSQQVTRANSRRL